MSKQHVHVRLIEGMAVSQEGELVERSRCLCGATWTKPYLFEDLDTD
jgi:hypothetical protein